MRHRLPALPIWARILAFVLLTIAIGVICDALGAGSVSAYAIGAAGGLVGSYVLGDAGDLPDPWDDDAPARSDRV